MGRAKAAVLPLPVWARPKTSWPARIRGMQWRCTGVGFFIPSSLQVWTAHSARPRSEKVVLLGVGLWSVSLSTGVLGFPAAAAAEDVVIEVGLFWEVDLILRENKGKFGSTWIWCSSISMVVGGGSFCLLS